MSICITCFELLASPHNHPQSLERELREISASVQALTSERQQLRDEDQDMIKRRAKLEFDVKDLEEGVSDDQTNKVQRITSTCTYYAPVWFE